MATAEQTHALAQYFVVKADIVKKAQMPRRDVRPGYLDIAHQLLDVRPMELSRNFYKLKDEGKKDTYDLGTRKNVGYDRLVSIAADYSVPIVTTPSLTNHVTSTYNLEANKPSFSYTQMAKYE